MEAKQQTEIFDIDMADQIAKDAEQKRIEIELKLKEKEQQRTLQRKEKQADEDKDRDPEEDYRKIDQRYQAMIQGIKGDLTKWKDLGDDKAKIDVMFKDILDRAKELREYIANYSYSIPAYNYQTYQTALDALHQQITKEKEAAIPKQKFSFMRKPAPAKTQATAPVEEQKHEQSKGQVIITNDLDIKEQEGIEIRKTEVEYEGKENVIIENFLGNPRPNGLVYILTKSRPAVWSGKCP